MFYTKYLLCFLSSKKGLHAGSAAQFQNLGSGFNYQIDRLFKAFHTKYRHLRDFLLRAAPEK
jgi:hypothetical protein